MAASSWSLTYRINKLFSNTTTVKSIVNTLRRRKRAECLSLLTTIRSIQNSFSHTTDKNHQLVYNNEEKKKDQQNSIKLVLASGAMFFGLFNTDKKEEEEEKEEIPDLIMMIKRSILMIQKGEFKKAEQMLHVALRQAQYLQNKDAVTYIYDVMANLAFDVGDYKKAEAIFISVMQRLIADGLPQDNIKIIHISLKMAKIYEQIGDIEKAEDGYKFCLKHLQSRIDQGTEDEDVVILWAMAMDWYARLLLSQSKNDQAFDYFLNAYKVSVKLNGNDHEQTVVLLNDLGTVSFLKGDNEAAVDYLTRAAEIGGKLPETMEELGSIHVNLGNVFIKQGLYDEAMISCQKGWKLSKKLNNLESLTEANDCIDELKKILNT